MSKTRQSGSQLTSHTLLYIILCINIAALLFLSPFCYAWPFSQEKTPEEIAKEYGEAVVLITASNKDGKALNEGSGFIVDPKGIVVTNYHYIRGADTARVRLANGAYYDVEGAMGVDQQWDIAVLKVKAKNLPFTPLGDSDELSGGERVVALCSSLKFENTVLEGMVDTIGDGDVIGDVVISFATTTPPDSGGGPLFNTKGQVIGLITLHLQYAKLANSYFAIRINRVKQLLKGEEIVALRSIIPPPSTTDFVNSIAKGFLAQKESSDINSDTNTKAHKLRTDILKRYDSIKEVLSGGIQNDSKERYNNNKNGQLEKEWSYKEEGVIKSYYESGRLLAEQNYKDGKLFLFKLYYESGQLMGEYNYKDGKLEGVYKYYYESGQLRAEYNYKDGKLEGITKGYYKDGQVRSIDTYKNGIKINRKKYARNGKLEFYQDYLAAEGESYPSGELIPQVSLPVREKIAKKEGLYKSHFKSGQLKAEQNDKDGKQEGVSKFYDESGRLETEVNFKDGKQEGVNKEYYESGQLKAEWNVKDGKLEGIAKEYYESGQLKAKRNYKDGKKEGISKSYYKSGRLMEESNFKNGKTQGIARWYTENGKLGMEASVKDDKLEGIGRMYYKDGQVLEEQNYKDGKREGITKGYYKDGNIHYIDTYKNGIKINRKKYARNGKLEFDQDYLAAKGESYPSGEPIPQISPPVREKIDPTKEIMHPNSPADGKLYALKTSRVFHRRECSVIQGEKDLTTFSSRVEALKVGAKPCSSCNP